MNMQRYLCLETISKSTHGNVTSRTQDVFQFVILEEHCVVSDLVDCRAGKPSILAAVSPFSFSSAETLQV